MRTARYLMIFSALVLALSVPAVAQRTAKTKPTPRPTPKTTRVTTSPVVAAAKQQVANQLSNVNLFVDILGPIAIGIEEIEREAKAKTLKKEVIDANETNKQRLIAAIRGLKEGLVTLESDFRTKPQLSRYLAQVQGVANLCARSEDSVIAGKFVAAKDPLRQVAQKLSDTMAVMP